MHCQLISVSCIIIFRVSIKTFLSQTYIHVSLSSMFWNNHNTVIPRLTKIIRSGITFVSRNLRQLKLLAVSNENNPVGLVCLPYVMWSAHFFVTHIQTEKISSWNGPTVHVCCFMLARSSTKIFFTRIHVRQPSPKNSEKKSSLAEKFVSRVTRQPRYHCIIMRID